MNRLWTRAAARLALAAVTLALIIVGAASAAPTAVVSIKLHSGEFCKKSLQGYYKRHGYICKRASDGRLRLFTY